MWVLFFRVNYASRGSSGLITVIRKLGRRICRKAYAARRLDNLKEEELILER